MALLKTKEKQVEVAENTSLFNAADELGIPFGCRSGMCRTCESEIISGEENLTPRNDLEDAHELPKGHRLLCQCSITKGIVEVRPVNIF